MTTSGRAWHLGVDDRQVEGRGIWTGGRGAPGVDDKWRGMAVGLRVALTTN